MIIFLYGSDGYRIKQAADRLVGQYKERHGPNAGIFRVDSGEESNTIEKISDLIKSVSFFDDRKIIFLNNIFNSGDAGKLAELIRDKGLADDKVVILIIVENAPGAELAKKNKDLWQLLSKKPIQSKSIDVMSDKKLENWIGAEALAVGLRLDSYAIKQLINIAGIDSWQLSMEISKLAAYGWSKNKKEVQGKGVGVTADDVKLLAVSKEDINVFGLLDALSSRNKAKTLTLLEDRIASGEDPHYLITMIAYQLRNLISVKDLTEKAVPYARIAKLTNIHPFAIRKAFDCSKNFELPELKKLFGRLTRLDVDIKNGDIDAEDGLYKFVLEF